MEALELLERALREMEAARDALAGAHTMSVLDIVAPSPFSLMVDALEYSDVAEAREHLVRARELLARAGELGVRVPEVDSALLWLVTDVLLDNPLFDFLRTVDLGGALAELDAAIERLRERIEELRRGGCSGP